MTSPSTPDESDEGWRRRLAEFEARKLAKRELRREQDRARRAGLKRRHQEKLRRARAGEPSTTNREESSS